MSRLGPWAPTTLEQRLDRMESLAEIRQLAVRYGLYLDARDMKSLVDLFVPDVRVGREETGRDALEHWFRETMRVPRASVHLVANHIIDFDNADHARGIVYCHDELERPATGRWDVGKLQYWDRYVRVEGAWCFSRRKFHRWYMVDAMDRPAIGAGLGTEFDALSTTQLPDAFDTWHAFWEQRNDE